MGQKFWLEYLIDQRWPNRFTRLGGCLLMLAAWPARRAYRCHDYRQCSFFFEKSTKIRPFFEVWQQPWL